MSESRLLDVAAAAAYLGGISSSVVRSLVAKGQLVPVRLPSCRRAGELSRRLLFAREDLDSLIDKWKKDATAKGVDGDKVFAEFQEELKRAAAGQ